MRRYLIAMFASLAALFSATGAAAAGETCPENMICASNPEGVAQELREIGYRAKLTKHDSSGDPQIESAANGYEYVINFNECTITVNCKSLGFVITFEKDGANSAELANKWNTSWRFSTMAYYPEDGTLSISYDVSTVGGLTKENFADVISWWDDIMGIAYRFFEDNPPPEAASPAAGDD